MIESFNKIDCTYKFSNEDSKSKKEFLSEAVFLYKNASFLTDKGDLQSCFALILKALDK